MLVPANYKRFIELIFERGKEAVFSKKYTAVLTTSIHFFDHTAHNYMHAICDDLNMKRIGSYSADMYDLLKSEERNRLASFAANLFVEMKNKTFFAKNVAPLKWRDFDYHPGADSQKVDLGNKNLLILTDTIQPQTNLGKMIQRFRSCLVNEVDLINLQELDIDGYCLGCLQWAYDNQCAYEGQDLFSDVFNNRIMQADILIWAGTIKDRYLSSKWKRFFDRFFFKGHAPSLSKKQIGLIISGPLSQLPNLSQILEAYFEVQQANLVDIVTDEFGDSGKRSTGACQTR